MRFRVEGMGGAWERLLEPFGLEPVADLLMDRNAGPVTVPVDGVEREVEAPFHLRNLPAFRDFRPFRTPARGGLSFTAASPLRVDPRRVAAAGYQAHVAATTTEHAWVRPAAGRRVRAGGPVRGPARAQAEPDGPAHPGGPVGGPAAGAGLGQPLPRRDPRAGRVRPRRLRARPGPLLRRPRAAGAAAGRPRAAGGLPPLSGGSRVGWRLAVAGLVPLLWVVLAVRSLRGGLRPGGWPSPHEARRSRPGGRWQRWPWCSWRCADPCPACTGT